MAPMIATRPMSCSVLLVQKHIIGTVPLSVPWRNSLAPGPAPPACTPSRTRPRADVSLGRSRSALLSGSHRPTRTPISRRHSRSRDGSHGGQLPRRVTAHRAAGPRAQKSAPSHRSLLRHAETARPATEAAPSRRIRQRRHERGSGRGSRLTEPTVTSSGLVGSASPDIIFERRCSSDAPARPRG